MGPLISRGEITNLSVTRFVCGKNKNDGKNMLFLGLMLFEEVFQKGKDDSVGERFGMVFSTHLEVQLILDHAKIFVAHQDIA